MPVSCTFSVVLPGACPWKCCDSLPVSCTSSGTCYLSPAYHCVFGCVQILCKAIAKGQLSQPVQSRLACCMILGKSATKFEPFVWVLCFCFLFVYLVSFTDFSALMLLVAATAAIVTYIRGYTYVHKYINTPQLSFGSRAFRISALKIWNSLPPHILQPQTLSSFRRHLKTHYYQSAYPAP